MPSGADAGEGGGEAGASDRLEQQVERLAVRLELGDQLVGAELLQPRAALGAPHHAGDMGAGALGELDREPADTAGRAGDQHAAAEQRAADLERPDRGQAGDGQRGGCLERDLVGQLGEPFGRDDRPLGPAALVGQADDARSVLRHAGDVPARDRPLGARRQAPDLAAVERDGLDLDERLARGRLWLGRLREGDARRGRAVGDEGAHQEGIIARARRQRVVSALSIAATAGRALLPARTAA